MQMWKLMLEGEFLHKKELHTGVKIDENNDSAGGNY